MKKFAIFVIGVILGGLLVWLWISQTTAPVDQVVPEKEVTEEEEVEEEAAEDMIRVTKPQPNDEVGGTLEVAGEAHGYWFFEADFPVTVTDKNGNELVSGFAVAEGDWMTEDFVPFKGSLDISEITVEEGFVVFERDNPSDLRENDMSVSVPVRFSADEEGEMMSVKVFFGKMDQASDAPCDKVYEVSRQVPKTSAIARTALEELLKGPSGGESGYITFLNDGIKIQKLNVEEGIAYADFDEALERNVGGSCRIAGIYAQIEETLTQFSSVNEVLISIDGRTEDILQP